MYGNGSFQYECSWNREVTNSNKLIDDISESTFSEVCTLLFSFDTVSNFGFSLSMGWSFVTTDSDIKIYAKKVIYGLVATKEYFTQSHNQNESIFS